MAEKLTQQLREIGAEEIRELERGRLRALVNSDMEAARWLHACDFQLITPRGRALSKDQYLQAITDGEIRYLVWEPGPMEVHVHEAVALIRYKARLQLASQTQQRPSFECWHTDSYEKRDGRWQVIWSQATKIE